MKYILMLTGTKAEFDWYSKWSQQDFEAQADFMRAFHKELKNSGMLVAAEGLAFPDEARVVRAGSDGSPIVTNGIVRGVKDGKPFVTDGVFPESKEFLAGYTIIDVESAEQAYEIAARLSASPGPGGIPGNMPVEVRQVMSGAPVELP
ncbi:MAG TPA: YciI family protein [Blastocatellia bacterium]|nr:YciI family protein [Blastocatellia bacterium]